MRRGTLVAIVAATSLAIGVSAASGLARAETLRFLDIEETFTPLDPESFSEQAPPQAGARFAFTEGLYRWAGTKRGKRAGRFEGMCTFTKVDQAAQAVTSYCVATAYLPNGQVVLGGFLRFTEQGPGGFVIPIMGGTGRYANARGTATFRDLPSGNQAVVLRLVP